MTTNGLSSYHQRVK
jgi:hypothetical protein